MVNTNLGSYSRSDKEYRKFLLLSGADTGSELAVQTVTYGKSGTSYLPLLMNSDGSLPIVANVGAGPNIGKDTAAAPGSVGYVGGNFNGSLNGVRMDSTGSMFQTAGSIWSMPAVSATNSASSKILAAHTGSPSFTGGNYLGSLYPIILNNGSDLQVVGSVYQVTSPWIVSGNVLVSGTVIVANVATAGSLSLQNVSLYGSSGTDLGIYSLRVISGTNSTLVTQLANSTVAVTAGSVIVTAGSIQVTVGAGSIQPYNPIGVGSIYGIGLGSVYAAANVTQVTSPWVISGNVLASGTLAVTQSTTPWAISGNVLVSGTVTIGNPAAVGSQAVAFPTKYLPIISNGSIVTTSSLGSKTIAGIQSEVHWISISGPNQGSTYSLQIADSEGYLIQPYFSKTGNSSTLTIFPVSGTLVLFISGAQVDTTYPFRVAYI